MLVALVGITLTIIALVASRGEVKEVQARLSIFGLVADRFEGQGCRRAFPRVKGPEDFQNRDSKFR
jgi:hypothetical protein